MPKKKDGTQITWKEFFSEWKKGIQNMTPQQKISNESQGTLITLAGFIVSFIALLIFHDKLIVSWFAYGLILVFAGSIWTTGIKWLALRQQLKFFKSTNDTAIDINNILNKLNESTELTMDVSDEKVREQENKDKCVDEEGKESNELKGGNKNV